MKKHIGISLFFFFFFLSLSATNYFVATNGVKLDLNRVHYRGQDESYRVYGPGDTFLGLAKLDLEKMELVREKRLQRK